MSKFAWFILALVALLGFAGVSSAIDPMVNYCMVPPFSARSLQPNVMIIMDNSGSMHEKAEDDSLSVFSTANTYYGYFNSAMWYTYSGATNRFTEAAIRSGAGAVAKQPTYWDGNFLNWMTMRRMDVVRKVIVGGTVWATSLPAGITDRNGVGPYVLVGENDGGNSTAHTITNAQNLIDQTQTNQSVTAGNINAISNTTGTSNFGCISTLSASATAATVAWTLTTTNAATEPLTTCAQIVLQSPSGAQTTMKAYGTANPGTFNALAFYNTNGPGTYQMRLTEFNGAGCPSSGSQSISMTGITFNVTAGPMPANTSKTFTLTDGTAGDPRTGLSSLLNIAYPSGANACGVSSSNYNVRVQTATLPQGIYQTTKDNVRYGLMFYNNGSSGNEQGGKLIQAVTNSTAAVSTSYITNVEKEHPGSFTPLAETIWTAIGYFAKDTSAVSAATGPRYYTFSAGASNSSYPINCDADPYNFTNTGDTSNNSCPNAIMVPCAQSYIILVTDGEPTEDKGLPTVVNNISASYAGVCGSDTQDGATACNAFGSPLRSNCCLDNSTMYGRTDVTGMKERDLRSDLTGDQSVISYMVFASFGSPGGSVLSVAARNGGFVDQNNNGVPDLTSEYDLDADGVPDTFFNATSGQVLQDSLTSALTAILKHAGSATANSLIGAGKGQGANLLQAFFYPRKTQGTSDLTWIGFLENLWFQVDPLLAFTYVRDDSSGAAAGVNPATADLELNTNQDKISSFLFDPNVGDTTIRRFNNNLSVFGSDILIDQMTPIWEAGIKLFNRTPASRTIYTTVNKTSKIDFTVANLTSFYSGGSPNRLQAVSAADATNIVNYIRGTDIAGSRTRTTSMDGGSTTHTWKLGDIIDSTAQIEGPFPLNDFDSRYNDATYTAYTGQNSYKSRGFIYAGANDGMFHAFYMGKLNALTIAGQPERIANLTDPSALGVGAEQWAFIPRGALPYLRYLMDNNYCHLYYLNAPPLVTDASIGGVGATAANYHNITKAVDGSTWRTIVIGSMGLGGGCGCSSTNCVHSATTTPADEGLSSYFAFDVTTPTSPVFLWEFSAADLGFSTAQPAIVKISPPLGSGLPDTSKNGKWFVVIGTGPTGDVDTVGHQFRGKSDQPLKYYILNLFDGSVVSSITPSPAITNAFAGNMTVMDTDTNYSDEVVYLNYVQKDTASGTWTQGGVLRLLTKESLSVAADWKIAPLIQNIGPIPTRVAALTARNDLDLWLYFGTGRYYFKDSSGAIDDPTNQRLLYGIKDPCFIASKVDYTCSTTVTPAQLTDATTNVAVNPARGWFINLDAAAGNDKAERLITDPQVSKLGAVFFTTFSPSSDPCTFGGKTFIWSVRFDNGGSAASFLFGTALTQTSTGAIQQVNLSNAFTSKVALTGAGAESTGRRTGSFLGQPPRIGALNVLTPPPIQSILRIQER